MWTLLRCGARSEYTAQGRAEYLVGVLLLHLLQRRCKFVDRRQAATSAWLRSDVESLHQTSLLLPILLTPRTYGQLFKATVYGTERKKTKDYYEAATKELRSDA